MSKHVFTFDFAFDVDTVEASIYNSLGCIPVEGETLASSHTAKQGRAVLFRQLFCVSCDRGGHCYHQGLAMSATTSRVVWEIQCVKAMIGKVTSMKHTRFLRTHLSESR